MTTQTTRRALAVAVAVCLVAAIPVLVARSTSSGRRALRTTGHSNDSVPGDGVVQSNQGDDTTTTQAGGVVTGTDGTTAGAGHQSSGKGGSHTGTTGGPSSSTGSGAGPGEGVHAVAYWPMFHGSAQHAGLSPVDGPSSAKVAWTYAPGDVYRGVRSNPVVGPNGAIYTARGSFGGATCQRTPQADDCGSVVDALSPAGSRIWEWTDTTEDLVRTTPAVALDGTVYITFDAPGAHIGDLVALTPSGQTKWNVTGHGFSGPPTIGPDGTLYLQDSNSMVSAVRPGDGQILWQFQTNAGTIGFRGTPAISPDGSTVYAGSGGGVVYALSTAGRLRWQASISGPGGGNMASGPAVGPDGTVYVATGGSSGDTPGDIDAFSPAGALKWHYTADGTFETTPTVGPNRVVVAGDDAGTVVAVAPGGRLAWSYQAPGTYGTNGFYDSSAAIGADGTVYIQNGANTVFALKDGNPVWTASGSSSASPALAGNGVLYVAGFGGLQAFHS